MASTAGNDGQWGVLQTSHALRKNHIARQQELGREHEVVGAVRGVQVVAQRVLVQAVGANTKR